MPASPQLEAFQREKIQNSTVLPEKTRRLVKVRSHMMFRPELIYIFD